MKYFEAWWIKNKMRNFQWSIKRFIWLLYNCAFNKEVACLRHKIKRILKSYDLKDLQEASMDFDHYFFDRYKSRIPVGWYGFDIVGFPETWCKAIDDILELMIKHDPNMEIHQIKMKWGGVRFYISSSKIIDQEEIEDLIENAMYDESLIY